MPSQAQLVAQMNQGLAIAIPDLDTSIGAPMRNVLDVVANVIAEQTADQYLLSYGYDINAMSGANLDAFVANFGFARFPAKRAVGYITFSRSSAAPSNIPIGLGTQISTQAANPIVFSTIIPALMPIGTNSITVPVQAILGGANGNVGANTVINLISPLMGISRVTNINAFINGADAESDDQLRTRFNKTVFRSLTGTAATYLGLALDDPAVNQVNIIGSDETFNEQIQILNGFGATTVQGLAYLYPNSTYFGTNLTGSNFFSPGSQYNFGLPVTNSMGGPAVVSASTSGGFLSAVPQTYKILYQSTSALSLLSPSGTFTPASGSTNQVQVSWTAPAGVTVTQYQIYKLIGGSYFFLASVSGVTTSYIDTGATLPGSGTPPVGGVLTVQAVDTTNIPDGIYQLQYRYLSTSSRNSPTNNITNRIDVYVNGIRPVEALQNISFYPNSFTFTNTPPADPILNGPTSMYVGQFARVNGGGPPTVGNYFTPLAYSPIIDMATGMQGGSILPVNSGGFSNWVEGTNFWVVNDISQFGQGPQSRAGIEWLASNVSGVSTAHSISVDYTFNQVPSSIQSQIQGWRILTTDVVVHQAQVWFLDMYLGVILANGYSINNVQTLAEAAITNYVNSISFDGTIQVSAILSAVQQVPGVIGVRFLTNQDSSTYYAIQQVQDLQFTELIVAQLTPGTLLSKINIYEDTLIVQQQSTPFTIYQQDVDYSIVQNTAGQTHLVRILGGSITNFENLKISYTYGTVLQTFATTTGTPLRAIDVNLPDNGVATLNNVTLIQLGQNDFGAV